jgi:hypothetical protein
MYDGVPTILDEMSFVHGPRELLAQYARIAEEAARERGVRLRISTDFDRLVVLNNSTPAIFNPKYNDLGDGTAFFIEGVDDSGDTVVTSASRLYDFGDRSLASELRSMRVYFAQPQPFCAGGRAEVTAPVAEHICGRAMCSGALWVRPDYRRLGFSRIIPRLTRSYSLSLWNPPIFWMLIKPELDEIGITRAYGSWQIAGKVMLHFPMWRPNVEFLIGTMGQTTLIRDLLSSVYGTSVGASRWMDTAIASREPRQRQGTSTRS